MHSKNAHSRFSSLARIIFSALLITLALSSGACSSSGTGTTTSATGTAQ